MTAKDTRWANDGCVNPVLPLEDTLMSFVSHRDDKIFH
jgi:hypothetical protein